MVVQRNVELGATVAASLQAPTLFLIADDLRRMEIAANIDETDVGRIKPGQRVTFTVNAYPGRTFEGVVKQVRLGSQTVQNVVIYTTIISIENPRRELLPGMTANLRIETDRRDNVVRIPNAALRWRPPPIVPDAAAPAPAAAQAGQAQRAAAAARGGGAARITEFVEAVKTELKLDADAARRRSTPRFAEMRKAFAGACAAASGPGRAPRARPRRAPGSRASASRRSSRRSSARNSTRSRSALPKARGSARARRAAASSSPASDGKPEGVTVRIGATDGGMTEIVSGLEAGREVIIGGGPARRTPPRPQRGPRFGF